MDGSILQNPADPDAAFRSKAGKQHRGYSANFAESVGEKGSIVTDYDLEANTHSDSSYAKEVIENMGKQDEKVTVVCDGAYGSSENTKLTEESNVDLVTTNMTGRKAKDIHADFELSDDGKTVVKCPGGYAPESCSCNPGTGQCMASFYRDKCEQCPFFKKCNPKCGKRTTYVRVSAKSKQRAEQQRYRSTEEFSKLTKFRNGVESVPSYLRRAHNVDHMPVRGLRKCRQLFGLKIGASNFRKFCRFMQSCCLNINLQANA